MGVQYDAGAYVASGNASFKPGSNLALLRMLQRRIVNQAYINETLCNGLYSPQDILLLGMSC